MGITNQGYSQNFLRCSTNEHLQQLMPDAAERSAYIQKLKSARISSERNTDTVPEFDMVVIPVVVHVVYHTAAENISDAQIISQITVLNKDYHRQNFDWNKTPSYWQSIVADANIQFCMAWQKPDGSWTNGIERKYNDSISEWSNNVKSSAMGGLDAWDRDKYLNIWVCKLHSGELGFAEYPGGSSATDGVVIQYDAFGTTGTLQSVYNKGRTATHEVGHWFNLFHIWGDSFCGDDSVADTPEQSGNHFGCFAQNTVLISCSNGPHGDMWMNYLDYTDDACMYMFSQGQAQRIRDAIDIFRSSIKTSPGCEQFTGINENELGNLVQVFPNPANDLLTFDTHFYSRTDLKIEIFDNMGRLVKSVNKEKIFMIAFPVDISFLPQGLYNIRITAQNLELNKKIFISR